MNSSAERLRAFIDTTFLLPTFDLQKITDNIIKGDAK